MNSAADYCILRPLYYNIFHGCPFVSQIFRYEDTNLFVHRNWNGLPFTRDLREYSFMSDPNLSNCYRKSLNSSVDTLFSTKHRIKYEYFVLLNWIKSTRTGDYVKMNWSNTFVENLRSNPVWCSNYPNKINFHPYVTF